MNSYRPRPWPDGTIPIPYAMDSSSAMGPGVYSWLVAISIARHTLEAYRGCCAYAPQKVFESEGRIVCYAPEQLQIACSLACFFFS
jgi:hypothetical protein